MESDFYSRYYPAVQNSKIHSEFCRHAFGVDLCQHGFADKVQIELILPACPVGTNQHALDIGCGNGMITEHLSDRSQAEFTGIDNSAIAIELAKQRTLLKKQKLTFIQGDINDLKLSKASYDLVLLIDSIYFSADYDNTTLKIRDGLSPDGCMIIFYSIGPALMGTWDFPVRLLEAEFTPIAEVLTKNGMVFTHEDLTSLDYELAKKRKDFLEEHAKEFREEGLEFIYENRMGDSTDIIKAVDQGLHKRYAYFAQLKQM